MFFNFSFFWQIYLCVTTLLTVTKSFFVFLVASQWSFCEPTVAILFPCKKKSWSFSLTSQKPHVHWRQSWREACMLGSKRPDQREETTKEHLSKIWISPSLDSSGAPNTTWPTTHKAFYDIHMISLQSETQTWINLWRDDSQQPCEDEQQKVHVPQVLHPEYMDRDRLLTCKRKRNSRLCKHAVHIMFSLVFMGTRHLLGHINGSLITSTLLLHSIKGNNCLPVPTMEFPFRWFMARFEKLY